MSVVGIFLNRKNLIVLLMAIELMLLAVNMNFVAFSHFLGDMHGQVFVFFILTVAAAESAIGLAILVVLFRNRASINVEELDASRADAPAGDARGIHEQHPFRKHCCWPCRWHRWWAAIAGLGTVRWQRIGRRASHTFTILGVLIAFVCCRP
jgi:NADH-quinone oxidoreductase subunit K